MSASSRSSDPDLTPAGATWRYPTTSIGRDERIDFLRGLAMLAVIVNHIALRSLYQIFSVEAIGVVTGAEGFVLLSGIILGLVYGVRLRRDGWRAITPKLVDRAIQLYLTALFTNFIVYLLAFVPFLNSTILTTYTDSDQQIVYSLYGDHPAVPTFIADLLLLDYGPGQINILNPPATLAAVLWPRPPAPRVELGDLQRSSGLFYPCVALPVRKSFSCADLAAFVRAWRCCGLLPTAARGLASRPI